MTFDPSWIGKTIGDGAFSIEHWLMGDATAGRLRGRDLRDGAVVHIGVTRALREPVAAVQERLSYGVDGVAALGFLGSPDHDQNGDTVVVELVDPGQSLTARRSTLVPAQSLHIAQRVAKIVDRATSRGAVLASFHPDLIRIDDGELPTLFPRFPVIEAIKEPRRWVGSGSWPLSDQGPFWEAITINPWYATAETDVYCFGLLLSWLFTGFHPFARSSQRPNSSWLFSMEADERDPFTGPPAIGAILDCMLLADRAQRAPITEISAMLDALSPADIT